MTFTSDFNINDTVSLVLKEATIRWCTVTAVKIEEDTVKCDLLTPSGVKLYDINSVYIMQTGENTDTSELEGMGKS